MLVDMFAVEAFEVYLRNRSDAVGDYFTICQPNFLRQLSSSRRESFACPLRRQQMTLGVAVDCHEQYPARTTKR